MSREVPHPKSKLYDRVDPKRWSPIYNVRSDRYGHPLSAEARESERRHPVYQSTFVVSKLREHAKKRDGNLGTTFFSTSFDCARRSWHFKLDLHPNEDVGVWVVERGLPTGVDILSANPLAPNFSSVFLEVQLKCRTLGTISITMFYSFAHNTH